MYTSWDVRNSLCTSDFGRLSLIDQSLRRRIVVRLIPPCCWTSKMAMYPFGSRFYHVYKLRCTYWYTHFRFMAAIFDLSLPFTSDGSDSMNDLSSKLSDFGTMWIVIEILTIHCLRVYIRCTSDLAAAILDLLFRLLPTTLAVRAKCPASWATSDRRYIVCKSIYSVLPV